MKRIIGLVLTVIGLIGSLMFGIQALQDSETFSFLGLDIGISSANWTPVIISVIILVIGIVVLASKK